MGHSLFDITLLGEGMVRLDFMHKDATTHAMKALIHELLRNAVSASDGLLSICKGHGWLRDSDTQKLVVTLQQGVETLTMLDSNMQH